MTYNTGNPVGSTDPRDLYDNAGNLDKLLNGPNPFYPDRLGQQRQSWEGMEQDFANAQDGRESAFAAAQADKEARFSDFLASSGYVSLGGYAAGITFTEYNEYVAYGGQFYRPAAATALPFTTTGTWATDEPSLSLLGDNVLRQDMANEIDPTKGAAMIGYRGRTARAKLDDIISVKDFGAVGDGVTDDLSAIQDAYAALSDGGTLFFPPGTYLADGIIEVKKFDIIITGVGATIVDMELILGKDWDEVNGRPDLVYIRPTVTGLTFESTKAASVNAITFRYVRGPVVHRCIFRNYNAAVFGMKGNGGSGGIYGHMTSQAWITHNETYECNYLVFTDSDTAPITQPFHHGDYVITHNKFLPGIDSESPNYRSISAVHAEQMDGMICSNNIFYMVQFAFAGQANFLAKQENIVVINGVNIVISDNQLFESGWHAVRLQQCGMFSITGNSIIFPGQLDGQYDGIVIAGGDANGTEFSNGTISGNIIQFPTRHGISVQSGSYYVQISGNSIVDAGNTSYNAGTPSSDSYAVISYPGSANINISDNMAYGNTTANSDNVAALGLNSSAAGFRSGVFRHSTPIGMQGYSSGSRPTLSISDRSIVFNETSGRPSFWNGTVWTDL